MLKTLLVVLTLTLASCVPPTSNETYTAYLNCYALDDVAKKECLEKIQFKMEKLAFKEFLNNHALTCKSIEDSPLFSAEKNAYLVICKPELRYLMQFNYKTKFWYIIRENNN